MHRQTEDHNAQGNPVKKSMDSYSRFAAMIATSTIVIYGLMYLNTYRLGDIYFSQIGMWMTLHMGTTMAVITLGYIPGMYRNRRVNLSIFLGSFVIFTGSQLSRLRLVG